jgi:hypothetical protein
MIEAILWIFIAAFGILMFMGSVAVGMTVAVWLDKRFL